MNDPRDAYIDSLVGPRVEVFDVASYRMRLREERVEASSRPATDGARRSRPVS
jgi:hypothetical protein